jgi:voltage-gated potassium channel
MTTAAEQPSRSDVWRRSLVPKLFDPLVIAGALATLPMIVLLERQFPPVWVHAVEWIVWLIFFLEYIAVLSISRSKVAYMKANRIGLAIVLLSFPELPAVLSIVRLVRLVRFFRLLRLWGVTVRLISSLGAVLGRTGLVYVASLSLVLLVAGGSALAILEPNTVRGGFLDGLWWAVVTATTTGYGDIAPVTAGGRLIAVLLMVTGVGLISTLAAAITAHFVAEDKDATLRDILRRLERIESLLEKPEAAEAGGTPRNDQPQGRALSSAAGTTR